MVSSTLGPLQTQKMYVYPWEWESFMRFRDRLSPDPAPPSTVPLSVRRRCRCPSYLASSPSYLASSLEPANMTNFEAPVSLSPLTVQDQPV